MKPKLKESEFLTQVIQYASMCGWLCYHQRPAQTAHGWRTAMQGDKGFPDLLLCRPANKWRPGEIIFAELKTRTGKLRPEQQAWLLALAGVEGVKAVCWRPEDWPEIEAVLR